MNSFLVLVVDDDEAFRKTICRVISGRGYRVDDASDGVAALRKIRLSPVDVLITDIIMPNSDGIELITAVKKDYPTTRIIAMSGRGSLGSLNILKMAEMIGADASLTKPFDPEDLLGKIDEWQASAVRQD